MKRSSLILCAVLTGVGGCARLSVEGGDKPIHIVMDINIKIDQKLDQFFAFEDRTPTSAPATSAPTTEASASSDDIANGGVR